MMKLIIRCPKMKVFPCYNADGSLNTNLKITEEIYSPVDVNQVKDLGTLTWKAGYIRRQIGLYWIVDQEPATGMVGIYEMSILLQPEAVIGPFAFPVKCTGTFGGRKVCGTFPHAIALPFGKDDKDNEIFEVQPVTAVLDVL